MIQHITAWREGGEGEGEGNGKRGREEGKVF